LLRLLSVSSRSLAMSLGYGSTQRAILALIDAHPDGAWSTAELCQAVYPGDHVSKKLRVALIRALKRMVLPDGWALCKARGQRAELLLYNGHSLDSVLHATWRTTPGSGTFDAFLSTPAAKSIKAQKAMLDAEVARKQERRRVLDEAEKEGNDRMARRGRMIPL
jgi:hypothetical protein